jgi:RNA polymerase sigma-70 factor (ECF subfamily)
MTAAAAMFPTVDDTLRRAAAGDGDAFAELIRAHEEMVFSIALHFFHDRGRAEEIAQEVFLQLYRRAGEIESASHLIFWLRRVTANRCIDESRRVRLRAVPLDDAPELSRDDAHSDPFLGRTLRRLLLDLPPQQRLAITLRFQEGLEPNEIAEVLGAPVNTIKSHLQRGLAALRKALGEQP